MVEADNYLYLLPASILDMYKMFKDIDMLSAGIWFQPYTFIPTLLGSDFGALGHSWSKKQCHYVMVEADSNLKLLPIRPY